MFLEFPVNQDTLSLLILDNAIESDIFKVIMIQLHHSLLSFSLNGSCISFDKLNM